MMYDACGSRFWEWSSSPEQHFPLRWVAYSKSPTMGRLDGIITIAMCFTKKPAAFEHLTVSNNQYLHITFLVCLGRAIIQFHT
jgi:hypothetical protein